MVIRRRPMESCCASMVCVACESCSCSERLLAASERHSRLYLVTKHTAVTMEPIVMIVSKMFVKVGCAFMIDIFLGLYFGHEDSILRRGVGYLFFIKNCTFVQNINHNNHIPNSLQ